MKQVYRRNVRHRPRSLPRRVLGWSVVVAGLVMLVLPGPGLLALALGIIILGRHDPTLRRWAVWFRLGLRRLSRAESPTVRPIGRWLREQQCRARQQIREQLQRHAHGQPLSPAVRLWIGLTLAMAIVSAGVGLYMILS